MVDFGPEGDRRRLEGVFVWQGQVDDEFPALQGRDRGLSSAQRGSLFMSAATAFFVSHLVWRVLRTLHEYLPSVEIRLIDQLHGDARWWRSDQLSELLYQKKRERLSKLR